MDYSQEEMKKRFLETMEHFQFSKWLAVEERGTKNNLLHLQTIVWHKDEAINKKACSIKSYRFNKQRLAKKSNKDITQVSFTIGKKKSLAPYAAKEFHTNFHITNLTQEEIERIEPWKKEEDKPKLDMENLICILKSQSNLLPGLFRNVIIYEYLLVNKLPAIYTLRKLTLLYNDHYNFQDYQEEIGSLRNTRFTLESQWGSSSHHSMLPMKDPKDNDINVKKYVESQGHMWVPKEEDTFSHK